MKAVAEKGDDINIIVILGAKPNSLLPRIKPDVVVAANSAVEIALNYRNEYGCKIISLVPGKDLFEQDHIRNSIRKSKPDKLVLLGTVNISDDPLGYVTDKLGIEASDVEIVSLHERNWGLTKFIGWRRFLIMLESTITRGLKHTMMVAIPDILHKKSFDWMGRSTGLNAILYTMKNIPKPRKIIVAGVGIQAEDVDGQHFNGQGIFKAKTAKADRLTMKHWKDDCRREVYTTDETLHSLGGVQMWKGDTFSLPND